MSSKAIGKLTDRQLQVLTRAERRLMAPCCYTQTIDVHSSEIAEKMRSDVLDMVMAGLDETGIYGHYKSVYGEQILAFPDELLGEVAFAVPIASATLAVGVLTAVFMKFHRRKLQISPNGRAAQIGPLTEPQQAILSEIRRATAW